MASANRHHRITMRWLVPLSLANRQLRQRVSMTPTRLLVLFCVILALPYNQKFWQVFVGNSTLSSLHDLGFLFAGVALLAAWITLFFNFFTFRKLFKPVIIAALLIASLANYFQTQLGTVIDSNMIHNVFQTDTQETLDLLSFSLFYYWVIYFLAPALLLVWIPIDWPPFTTQVRQRAIVLFLCLATLGSTFLIYNKDFTFLLRQQPVLRSLINPTYPVHALVKATRETFAEPTVVTPIGEDAAQIDKVSHSGARRVFVLVVGETARANNFSLNGYPRITNPELSALDDVINFQDAHACGTSTAVSLPCMFSHLPQQDYSPKRAKRYENLFDVLRHAGIASTWIDNQSGCKGTCDSTVFKAVKNMPVGAECKDGQCFDGLLNRALDTWLDELTPEQGDQLVVLHQAGSHGPAYYKRVPDEFRQFTPECRLPNLQDCTREEVKNSYDNTILYTDHVLADLIQVLRAHQDKNEIVMYYASDHGESLGENGLYLHGMPKLLAPKEQTQVPTLVWMSEPFQSQSGLSRQCLAKRSNEAISHDNLFHSVLGALRVSTSVYQPSLDLFRSCNQRLAANP